MSTALIVPFRPDGAERDRNWRWLRERYQRLYPDWEIVEGSCASEAWSKGRAVNAAVAKTSAEVLVVIDADVLLGAEVLPEAVASLQGAAWVIPHGMVYRLNEATTRALLEDRLVATPRPLPPSRLARSPRRGPAGGGASVIRRGDFEAVGGIDEAFEGWGGEDISFGRALDTLIGDHKRLGTAMWHLRHRPMPRRPGRRASPESEALAGEYLDAEGDPVAMLRLCTQRPYQGLAGGGAVVARREVVSSIPLDERFVGWG